MRKNYRNLEDKVIDLFTIGDEIYWKHQKYEILQSGKPNSQSGGEPKTDVYLKLQNIDSKEIIEFKISCKLEGTNEFQENKIQASRAKQIWGDNWQEIIGSAALSIKPKFESRIVYFPDGYGRTKETQYTNGWKVEIASKPRELAVQLKLSDQEIRDRIYKGTTLDREKRDSYVNGILIENSGVAEFMLITTLEQTSKIDSPAKILDSLILIDNYPIPKHYIIFTGNNYRVLKDKHDGDRPLGVQVIWAANKEKNRLEYTLKFNSPLDENFSAKKIALITKNEIEKLGKIFAPITLKKKDPETNKPILDKDGNEQTYTVSVFDISQTSGKELAKAFHGLEGTTSADYSNLYKSAKAVSEANGIPISFKDIKSGENGLYIRMTNEIVIQKGLSEQQTLKTIFQEMAHSELHTLDKLPEQPMSRSTRELQAELVAFVVASYYGLDTSEYNFGYLATRTQNPEGLSSLEAQIKTVQKEADSLISRIDKSLEKHQIKEVTKDAFQEKLDRLKNKDKEKTLESKEKEHAKEMPKKEHKSDKEMGL